MKKGKSKEQLQKATEPAPLDLILAGYRWMVTSHTREMENVLDQMQNKCIEEYRMRKTAEARTEAANQRIKVLEAELAALKKAAA